MQKKRATAGLHKTLLSKQGYKCAVCEVILEVVPLEIAHVVALSSEGESREGNLTVLCSSCHHYLDRQPKEFEFVSFVTEILKSHPSFSDVQQEVILGGETRYRADILASRQQGGTREKLLIECKTPTVISSGNLPRAIKQLENYRAVVGDCRMVLAVPATLSEADLSSLIDANIEVWDLPYLASQFEEQIYRSSPNYYRVLLTSQLSRLSKPSREQELINALAACSPGKADCYVYQSLVGEILECLFTPPLGKPLPELSDKTEANRRDFIMPNYSESGFWSFIRNKYDADYIVIDAKNYTRKLRKPEVLQIANYLKLHGAGLFGIIISRNGGDASGCEHTLREQWIVHRKMILILDDEDIKSMLMAKSDGRQAEDILGQRIERFRLSM